jgi:1,4-dihydroxy-2-naphthoate octaprenyltransferase
MSAVAAWSSRILTFVRLGRPHFLAGGFVMHGLGVAVALYHGAALNWSALLWGQLTITATQLMVHYANDYFDLTADSANSTPTAWSGGSRVLPAGLLEPQVALVTALLLGGLALSAGLILAFVVRPGALTGALVALALALAWGYSGPPLRLHAHGLGQFAGVLVVAGLTPLLGYHLQAGRLSLLPLLALLPVACLQFGMLLAVDFPDREGDAAAGKRTLVVRLGAPAAARLYVAVLLATYLGLPLLVLAGLPSLVAAMATLTAPLGVWLVVRIWRGAWAKPGVWNSLAFWSVALLVGVALAETLAFLWLALTPT